MSLLDSVEFDMQLGLIDILQSTGPIALNELIMRTHAGQGPEELKELVEQLQKLIKAGMVTVTGPGSNDLSKMTAEGIAKSSDAIVEVSRAGLRRTFAS